MELLSPELLAIVPLTVGLVAALRGFGIPSQYAPVASILTGVALAFLVVTTVPEVILGGLAIGLMASGLYSGGKTILGA